MSFWKQVPLSDLFRFEKAVGIAGIGLPPISLGLLGKLFALLELKFPPL